MRIKLGVIFGGSSVEHEISVISALQAIEHINKEKYEVIPIYIGKNRVWYTSPLLLDIKNYKDLDLLTKNCKSISLCKKDNEFHLISTKGLLNKTVDKIDVAFPIVHGQNVEDGTLAGYLDTIGIPYVGSNTLASAIGQDKVIIKEILKSNNIPVVDYTWFYDTEFEDNQSDILKDIKKIGYPVVVKPASLGSSVGINFVKNEKTIIDAITEALEYDKKIVVEKAVDNLIEVNCSVLGNYEDASASVIEQVSTDNDLLTFDDKYTGSGKSKGIVNTSRIIPAKISKELTDKIKNTSLDVFRCLNFSGVVRIDYLIDSKSNKYYVNEPNTIPGSLSFYLWEKTGLDYTKLLDDLITIGIRDYKNKQKKQFSFDTNVLKNFNGLKGMKK